MDRLIESYEIQLVEPGCAPGTARWGAQVSLPDDISAVFPYLNAVLDGAWYDHENQVLIWREDSQAYAFRPHEILVAQVQDPLDARKIVSEMATRVNRIWQERESITPRFTERKLPAIIDIFKLLPQTNCRLCGYPTCMAFAADLSQGKAELEHCPPLSHPECAEKREKIGNLFIAD